MTDTNSRVEHDYLESYFYWKAWVKGEPEKFPGLQFPLTWAKWMNMLKGRGHSSCPICHQIGAYSYIDNAGNEHEVKCLCNVAQWTYRQDQMTQRWKDPYEQTTWGSIIPTDRFNSINGKSGADVKAATGLALSKLFYFATANDEKRWNLLRGTFGSGKSTMLKMVATELFPIATYVTAGNLKNRFRIESIEGDIAEMINAFSKVRILIIDDLGMEYDGSGFTTKTLRNIIDNRMAFPFKFPTLASTNMSLDESDLISGKNPDDTRAIISRFLDPRYSDVHLLYQGDARRVGYQNIVKGEK